MLGVTLSLAAGVGFAVSAIFVRLASQHIRATTTTLVSLIVGTFLTMILAFSLHANEILALSGIAFLWFCLLGAINFPVGRLLNFTGVSLAGVSRATPVIGSSPLFAVALATTIGGESVDISILVGTVSIVGGLVLILSQR